MEYKMSSRQFLDSVEKIFDELKIKYPDKNIKIFSSDYLVKKKESKEI